MALIRRPSAGHYDKLFVPTTAGACGACNVKVWLCNASDEGVGIREQLVRVPICQSANATPDLAVHADCVGLAGPVGPFLEVADPTVVGELQ
jgi:hypothetical protein